MNTNALSDLIRGVDDDSPAKDKAIFHLWAALEDIEASKCWSTPQETAAEGIKRATAALEKSEASDA